MEERVHPIPFRTRQLSSPSSMILRTLTWESRTTPRLYFQRAVLSRRPFVLPEAHPHHGPPLPKPQARRKPLLLFLPLPLPSGFLPPAFFSYGFTRPVRSIIGVSLPFPSLPFRSSLFPRASSICRRRALDAVSGSDASLLGVLGNTSLPRALVGALFPNEKEMRRYSIRWKTVWIFLIMKILYKRN